MILSLILLGCDPEIVPESEIECASAEYAYYDGLADPGDTGTWDDAMPAECTALVGTFMTGTEPATVGTAYAEDPLLMASVLSATVDGLYDTVSGPSLAEVCVEMGNWTTPGPPIGNDPSGFCAGAGSSASAPFTCGWQSYSEAMSNSLTALLAGSAGHEASFLYMDFVDGALTAPPNASTLIWFPVLFAAAADVASDGAASVLSFRLADGRTKTIGVLGVGYTVQGTSTEIAKFQAIIKAPQSFSLADFTNLKVDIPTSVLYRETYTDGSTGALSTRVKQWVRNGADNTITMDDGTISSTDPWRFADVVGIIDPCANGEFPCVDTGGGLTADALYEITAWGYDYYDQNGANSDYLPGWNQAIQCADASGAEPD